MTKWVEHRWLIGSRCRLLLLCCGVLAVAWSMPAPPGMAVYADDCDDYDWTEVYWTGGAGTSAWTDTANWSGLEVGDLYPGYQGSCDYCVVIDHPDPQSTVVIDLYIKVRTIYIGEDMVVKVLPDGHLQLASHGGDPGGTFPGPPSFICDGELHISASRFSPQGESPGEVTLDGGYAGDNSCVLNGAIRFYKEPVGLGIQPGVLNFSECTRLVSTGAGVIDGTGFKGLIEGPFLDTFTFDQNVTLQGELDISVWIPAWFDQEEMGTINSNLPGKQIRLFGLPKLAMGTYQASGGKLKMDVAISGVGNWQLDSGEIEINVACPSLNGEFLIDGGTFDANANWTTTGDAFIEGDCAIEMSTGVEVTVDSLTVDTEDGSVQVTFSGGGKFKAN